jgi:L-iditol 2-dehydrogenase
MSVHSHTAESPSSPVAIPSTMSAGVYRGAGRVAVETVPVPQIGEGEVLFRVGACGICGTDLKKIHHGFVPPPQIFGHELAGTVVAVGRGVRRPKVGDRVVSFHHIPCGNCFYCERELFSQCAGYKKVGLTAGFEPNGGGFAQYVRAMPWIVERGMIALPDDVTFEEASFVEPVNTCLKAIHKARVSKGEIVVVIGQGPIGLLLMMLARLQGATLITSDPVEGRRAASKKFGAHDSVAPADLTREISKSTHNRGADVVILAVPHSKLVAEALALARPGGRILLFAQNDPQMRIEFPAAAVGVEEKEILGSYSASVKDQPESAALVFNRRLPVKELISHRFPLSEIAAALELAAHPKDDTLKVVITNEP